MPARSRAAARPASKGPSRRAATRAKPAAGRAPARGKPSRKVAKRASTKRTSSKRTSTKRTSTKRASGKRTSPKRTTATRTKVAQRPKAKGSADRATPAVRGTPARDPTTRAPSLPARAKASVPGGARALVQFEAIAPPTRPLRIALFGASGNLGSRIAKEALARGHHVTAAERNPTKVTLSGEHLGRVKADVTDPVLVSVVARDHDVVASAVSPGDEPGVLATAARSLLDGARSAGVKRVVAVGGAGSLEVAPGKRLMDSSTFPGEWRPIAQAHADALQVFRERGQGVDWTVVSPSAMISPGKRTGKYRIGTEQLLTDVKGESRISMEDYAVAFVDELERGHYMGRRMTVGY